MPTLLCEQVTDQRQQNNTIQIPPLIITGREMMSDVTQGRRPKHGIAKGMNGNIAIGVCRQAPVMGQANATEHDMVTIGERVNIQALSNPELHLMTR